MKTKSKKTLGIIAAILLCIVAAYFIAPLKDWRSKKIIYYCNPRIYTSRVVSRIFTDEECKKESQKLISGRTYSNSYTDFVLLWWEEKTLKWKNNIETIEITSTILNNDKDLDFYD